MIALLAACVVGCGLQEEDAELKKAWDGHVKRLSTKKAVKLLIAGEDKATDVDPGEVAKFWDAARAQKVLKGPACRCEPRPDSQFVLLLEDLSVVTIQIVSKHWFKGTVLVGGHSTDFYFLDPKDRFAELAKKLLAPPKSATMCEKCAGKAYIKMMGTCSACPGVTSSAAYKLCLDCAAKKGVCQVCEDPLKK